MVASDKTGNKTLKDLINDSVKGTVGTSTTEEALTVKDVKPPKATFKATEDTEVTVTVGSDKYNDATLKFYVRLGTATTTAYKAHKVTFSVKDGVAGDKLKVDTDPATKEFEVTHDKTGTIYMPEGKIKFTLTTSKPKADWTGIEGATADALTQTVEAAKFTKDLTVTAKPKN